MRTLLCLLILVVASFASGQEALRGWRPIGVYEPNAGKVESFRLSPDGKRVVTLGRDRRLVLWDTGKAARITVLDEDADVRARFVFSSDSELIARALPWWGGDAIRVWRSSDGKELEGLNQNWLDEPVKRRTKQGRDVELGWRVVRGPSGAVVFVDGDDLPSLAVGRLGSIAATDWRPRRSWRIAPDGRRVVRFASGGYTGGHLPTGSKRRTLEACVHDLETGKSAPGFALDEVVGQSSPYFRGGMAFDFEYFYFLRSGEVQLLESSTGKIVRRFGQNVSVLAEYGTGIATGHDDGMVRTWNAAGECTKTLAGHVGRVHALRIDAGMLTAMNDEGITIFNGNEKRGHYPGARALTCAGPYVAVQGWSWLRVYQDGELMFETEDGVSYDQQDDRCVAAAIGGSTLTYRSGMKLVVHDLETGRPIGSLHGHRAEVQDIEWLSRALLVKSIDGSARVELPGGEISARFASRHVHPSESGIVDLSPFRGKSRLSAQVSPNGTRWVLRRDEAVEVRETAGDQPLVTWPLPGRSHEPVAISRDGEFVATASKIGERRVRVTLHEVGSPDRPLFEETIEDAHRPRFLVFGPDDETVLLRLSGLGRHGHRGNFVILDRSGKELYRGTSGPARMSSESRPRAVDLTPDGRFVIHALYSGPVTVFDLRVKREVLSFKAPRETYSHFVQLECSPRGGDFTLTYPERNLVFWANREKGLIDGARFPRVSSRATGFLPSGDLLVLRPEGLERWSATTRRQVATWPDIRGEFLSIAPNGQRMAVISGSRVRVYDAAAR